MIALGFGEDGPQDLPMRAVVAELAEREPERMRDEAGEGRTHAHRDRWHLGDGDGRDPRLVQTSLEQPDRLLADRSGRDEQGEVDLLGTEPVDGRGDEALEDAVAARHVAHRRDGGRSERSDEAGIC